MVGKKKGGKPNKIISRKQTISYSAPLPEASQFAYYDNVLPGAADRILTMAENQARHRQKLENKAITGDQIRSFLGLIFGFLVSVGGFAGSIFLIYSGKSIEGSLLASGVLASLVYTFVSGSNKKMKDVSKKD